MSYLSGFDAIAKRGAARLADVLGTTTALVPHEQRDSFVAFLKNIKNQAPPDVEDGWHTAVGALAGGVLWGRSGHPYLGLIGGASAGRNLPALVYQPDKRRLALSNLGITSAGVLGSLAVPKHRVLGFILGWLAGGAVTYAARLKSTKG